MDVESLMGKLKDGGTNHPTGKATPKVEPVAKGFVRYESATVGSPLNTVTPGGVHVSLPITTDDVRIISHLDELQAAYKHLINVVRG